jgi:hypothetical protein
MKRIIAGVAIVAIALIGTLFAQSRRAAGATAIPQVIKINGQVPSEIDISSYQENGKFQLTVCYKEDTQGAMLCIN